MRLKALFAIFIIILGGVFLFRNDILNFYSEFFQRLPQVEKTTADFLIEKVKKEVVAPQPLRATKEDPQSFLTQDGVIQWTNIRRERNGLFPLSENVKLNATANIKLRDMFEKQYFAHMSPLGAGVGDLAVNVGYEFISIGENLALGNFKDDEELVQGWMDSPGHRANILSSRYQDIGVAVGRGIFEGKSTWLAVQIFGLSLSVCPQPEETLKAKIEIYESQLNELQKTLESLQRKIKSMWPKRGLTYNKKVSEYNRLIGQYKNLLRESRALIVEYNGQIKLFNECAIK